MVIRPIEGAKDVREEESKAPPISPKALRLTSSSSGLEQITGLFQQYAPLAYMLPWEILDYIELLSVYNPDYSQAVENVRSLANSGHTLIVEGGGKRASQRIKSRIEEKARTIQESHGGIDGLLDKLLDQGATYGAIAGEWIVDENLTDVIDFADINPKLIRFFWDKDFQKWVPFQKVAMHIAQEAEKAGQEVRNGVYIRLNELTFRYFAFDAAPSSPYGNPPFLASLANIAIQRDMIQNMAQIVKKIGLLGIIDLSVKALPKKMSETDEGYMVRATTFLEQYVRVVQDMVRDGGMIHFDDLEAKTYQITGNAAGATNIFKQNEELVISGLKSMPSIHGRSYCVVPETKVLTADLRWENAGDLLLDDELVGFDEDLGHGRGKGYVAKMRRSIVESNKRIKLPCVRVITDKGTITVSEQHPMVVIRSYGRIWQQGAELKPGDRLNWIGHPWEEDRSYESGYLSGILDGEGSLGAAGSGKNGSVQFSQLPGAVLEESLSILKRMGFDCSVYAKETGVTTVRIIGGKYDTMKLLGTVRPLRLLEKAPRFWDGVSLKGSTKVANKRDVYATVLKVESVGKKEVVALQTSSRTFISEGLLSHNSTTETYAGVAYDIILRNISKYQRAVKRMIESGYWLMATLWGENPESIRMSFNSNKSLNRLQEAQAESHEIANVYKLWIMGIIDQLGASQELGYSQPKLPLEVPPPAAEMRVGADASTGDDVQTSSDQGTIDQS